jgi:hypothetical protein
MSFDNVSYQKYLKYKTKYLELKQMIGGVTEADFDKYDAPRGVECPADSTSTQDKVSLGYFVNTILKNKSEADFKRGDAALDILNRKGGAPGSFGATAPEVKALKTELTEWKKAGCIMPDACKDQASKPDCSNMTNPKVFDPNTGYLCRWNMTNKACEKRPENKVGFQ